MMSMKKLGFLLINAFYQLALNKEWQDFVRKTSSQISEDTLMLNKSNRSMRISPSVLATVLEVLRLSKHGYSWCLRRPGHSVKIGDFILDEETTILPCRKYSDKIVKRWKKSLNQFCPQLWFDEHNIITDSINWNLAAEMLPFGSGNSKCPGQALVERTLIIFIQDFVSNFEITHRGDVTGTKIVLKRLDDSANVTFRRRKSLPNTNTRSSTNRRRSLELQTSSKKDVLKSDKKSPSHKDLKETHATATTGIKTERSYEEGTASTVFKKTDNYSSCEYQVVKYTFEKPPDGN